jgi:hypothetical protein
VQPSFSVDTGAGTAYKKGRNGGKSGGMKTKILIGIILITVICPPSSHALGLFRYVFDGITSMLGLDRGPIPKVLPQAPPPGTPPQNPPPVRQDPEARIHIQADGF